MTAREYGSDWESVPKGYLFPLLSGPRACSPFNQPSLLGEQNPRAPGVVRRKPRLRTTPKPAETKCGVVFALPSSGTCTSGAKSFASKSPRFLLASERSQLRAHRVVNRRRRARLNTTPRTPRHRASCSGLSPTERGSACAPAKNALPHHALPGQNRKPAAWAGSAPVRLRSICPAGFAFASFTPRLPLAKDKNARYSPLRSVRSWTLRRRPAFRSPPIRFATGCACPSCQEHQDRKSAFALIAWLLCGMDSHNSPK